MPNEIILVATRPIRRFIRNLAPRLCFLALAAALAFPLLNTNADPLHDASKNGNLDEINRLITGGADVNANANAQATSYSSWTFFSGYRYGDRGWPPLHWAIDESHESVAIVLPAAGANVNANNNNYGQTPLHIAVYRSRKSIMATLLAAGADFHAKDKHRCTRRCTRPIERASVAEALVAAGVDINAKDNKGRTPLHQQATISSSWSARESIDSLLSAGANINAKDSGGWTTLHWSGRILRGEEIKSL